MYLIGICDDEPIFSRHMAELTKEIMEKIDIPCKILTFKSGTELLSYIQSSIVPLNLLLLDILLKEENGIQLARQLRQAQNNLPIVFITSSMDFVLEGYTVEPLGYLLKPIDTAKLEEVLLRACKKSQKQRLLLTTPSQTVSFVLDDVLYLEICNKTLSIHIADGNVLEIAVPLSALTGKLPPKQFVQCHRSYIVSLAAITSIRRYMIQLKNHETIPVSKTHYQNVQNALLSWANICS